MWNCRGGVPVGAITELVNAVCQPSYTSAHCPCLWTHAQPLVFPTFPLRMLLLALAPLLLAAAAANIAALSVAAVTAWLLLL